MLLRWRAPELTLLLADRAVSAAQDDTLAALRADHLAVFALNRLGRHGEAAHRLIPAIGDAETPPALRHELNVELAHCAAALGEPITALGAARAVLAAGDDVAPALRGRALVAVAEACITLGRDDLVSSALEEADELYREDPALDHDTALLLRAAVRIADAGRHRARGAAQEAEAKAREGRELLAGLADPDQDSGEASARLMLELALTMLDRGAGEAAAQEVRPMLRRQVRAAAAGTVARLRLALATQVHLAEGGHEPALTLLADAVEGAQRYGLDAVLAECLEGLSHVHEARGEFADALHCVRAACAAEGRHRREAAVARSLLLENCDQSARREEAHLIGHVAELLANTGPGCAGLDADTGPLHLEIMVEAVAVPAAEGQIPEVQVAEVESGAASVAETETAETEEVPEHEALETEVAEVAEEIGDVEVARHRHGAAGPLVSVSDLLPAAVLSAGRSGRRRAERSAGEPDEECSPVESHQTQDDDPSEVTERISVTRREFGVSGPPPAPTPRALEWEPDVDPAQSNGTSQLGLGDLLAEALAAYQESRDVHPDTRPVGTLASDGSLAADAVTTRDLPRYRGPGTRWTGGLALALSPSDQDVSDHSPSDPDLSDEDDGEPSEAITNPLLRLPELTSEPRWITPEAGRRSAAGD